MKMGDLKFLEKNVPSHIWGLRPSKTLKLQIWDLAEILIHYILCYIKNNVLWTFLRKCQHRYLDIYTQKNVWCILKLNYIFYSLHISEIQTKSAYSVRQKLLTCKWTTPIFIDINTYIIHTPSILSYVNWFNIFS